MAPSAFGRRGSSAAGTTPPVAPSSKASILSSTHHNNLTSSSSGSGGSGGTGTPAATTASSSSPLHSSGSGSVSASTVLHAFPHLPTTHVTHPSSQGTLRGAAATAAANSHATYPHVHQRTQSSAAATASATPDGTPPPRSEPFTARSFDNSSFADATSPQGSPGIFQPSSFPTVVGGANVNVGNFGSLSSASYFPSMVSSDQQSMHSTGTTVGNSTFASSASTITSSAFPAAASSSSSMQSQDNSLRETLARRIRTFAYLKRCLSAGGHPASGANVQHFSTQAQSWLDAVRITRRSLESYYQSDTMRKRANRYYILGCSLAPTMELTSGSEFARAVLAVLNEVDSMAEVGAEKDKAKMRNFFKSSIRSTSMRRAGGVGGGVGLGGGGGSSHYSLHGLGNTVGGLGSGLAEFSSTYDGVAVGGPAFSTLCVPSGIELIGTHTPFPLDFLQTTITFMDMLQEVYCKFILFLSNASGQAIRDADGVPLGGLGGSIGTADSSMPFVVECTNKVDARVKKILMAICKELDTLARHLVRQELASLDPQLARDLGAAAYAGNAAAAAEPSSAPSATAATASNGYLSADGAATISAGPSSVSKAHQGSLSNGRMYTGSAPNLLLSSAGPPSGSATPSAAAHSRA